MKEDAVDPSFFNFFLEAWQKRLFSPLHLHYITFGCILFLQAVLLQT